MVNQTGAQVNRVAPLVNWLTCVVLRLCIFAGMKSIITKTLTAALLVFSAVAATASARIISPAQALNLNETDPCNVQSYDMESFQLTDNSDNSMLMYSITVSLDAKKPQPDTLYVVMTIVNCKGTTQTIRTQLFYDAKTNTWNGKQALKNNAECPWKLQSYSTLAVNPCGEEYATDENEIGDLKNTNRPRREKIHMRIRKNISGTAGKAGKDSTNGNDSGCNRQIFMMDDISLQDFTDNSFLSYSLSISFSAKAPQPSSMFVLMTVVNCKGETRTIKTELFYNAKTNTWTGKDAMLNNKECPWKLSSYSILATNACGDEFAGNEIETGTVKNRPIRTLADAGKLPARDRIIERRRRG